jgi:hypothetical protein
VLHVEREGGVLRYTQRSERSSVARVSVACATTQGDSNL